MQARNTHTLGFTSTPINMIRALLVFLLTIMVTACATRLAETSPESTDLSGVWVLDAENSQTPLIRPGQQRSENHQGRGGGLRGGGSAGERPVTSTAQASRPEIPEFMRAVEMTIAQDNISMGVSYPKATYRDVDWGKTARYGKTIVAGWDQDNLIINTESGLVTTTETYSLTDAGETLVLIIEVKNRRSTDTFVRVFKKKKAN